MNNETIGLLIQGFIILAAFSILYKDNPVFKFTENLYVGIALANWVIVGMDRTYKLGIKPAMAGNLLLVIPLILGAASYLMYSRKYNWIGRIPLSMMAALGLAFSARGLMTINFIGQIKAMMVPLTNWENVLSIVGATLAILYFFYSVEQKGPMGSLTTVGRWFLMLAMGAFLSQSLFMYCTNVIGSVQNLLEPPAYMLIPVAVALVAIDAVVSKMGIYWRSSK